MLVSLLMILSAVFLLLAIACFIFLLKRNRGFWIGIVACALSVVCIRAADKVVDSHLIFVNPRIPLSYMVLGAS